MKKIECIIPVRKFAELEKALREWGIRGMTVSDVRGFGNEQTRPESFLYLPKTRIEIFCREDELDDLIAIMTRACQTGQLGDGKIAVTEVSHMVRIRTGETGEVAV